MSQRSTHPPSATNPSAAPPRLPAWLLAGLLALATIILYWPALQHDFVNYDDDRYVTANTEVQKGLAWETIRWSFSHPVADNWHPLTVLSHQLACQFFGLNPRGHHLVSVSLHGANAALVFLWLRRATGAIGKSPGCGSPVRLASLAR